MSKKGSKIPAAKIIRISLLALVLGYAVYHFSNSDEKPVELPFNAITEGPDLISKDLHVVLSDSGKVRRIMDAPVQIRLKNQDEIFSEGLNISFFEGDSIVSSTIVADSGYYHHDKDMWSIAGNVVVDNKKDGKKLESDLLHWKPKEHTVRTDEKVKITTSDQVLTGVGLDAKDDFSEYEIHNVITSIALD